MTTRRSQIVLALALMTAAALVLWAAGTRVESDAFQFNGTVEVLGGGNVMTNDNPSFTSVSNAALWASNTWVNASNRVYAVKTNEIAGGWYSINSSVTSLLMRVDEQMVITQLWAIADYPGCCTATVFYSTYWSNAVIGYTVATNVQLTSTGSVINCYALVPKDGGIWQSSGIGATSCTNATVGVRGVDPQ